MKKLGGRKKGSVNKIQSSVREIIETALNKSLPESIMEEINKVKDPAIKAGLQLQLMAYSYPKLKQIDHIRSSGLQGMTPEQKLEAMKQATKLLEAQIDINKKDGQ